MRGEERENPVPRCLFAPKQNGMACYAGFSPDTNGQTLCVFNNKEFIKYFMQTKIGFKKKISSHWTEYAKVLMNKAREKKYTDRDVKKKCYEEKFRLGSGQL